jgi:hypothetical protein
MAMMTTDVQMLFGGTSEPAYYLIFTALPSIIAPTMNKRGTHLIQAFVHESLQIPPKRGVVRFEAVLEQNLATNGITTLHEIEQLEKLDRQSGDDGPILRAFSRQSRRSKKSSTAFSERFRGGLPSIRSATPSSQRFNTAETTHSKSTDAVDLARKRVKKRQSIFGFFRK